MARRDPSHVVMVGTSFETHGGIASVLKTYRSAGLFDRWPIDYVASHRDGSGMMKLMQAVRGLLAFIALLWRHPRAVLHVHSASRASFWRKSLFMALAFAARWPVIFHLHGGGFATFYDAECGPVRRALVRFFLNRASCIVVVSQRWCAWMHQVTRNPRVVSIVNPVAIPAARGIERQPQLVAFTGRYEAGKGVFDLLAAAAGLSSAFPGLRVELAGSGDAQALEQCAGSLGIADRVTLNGWIDAPAREELLARATVFVLPSHAEGLPLSVLEAMAAGCPVVATSVGGLPDLIADGVSGLLVPAGDPHALAAAIHRVLNDASLAAALARNARDTIESRYTPERSLARLEALYAELGVERESAPAPSTRNLQEIS